MVFVELFVLVPRGMVIGAVLPPARESLVVSLFMGFGLDFVLIPVLRVIPRVTVIVIVSKGRCGR